MPRPATSGNAAKGMYVTADFAYDAARDVYACPAGEDLIYRYTREEIGLQVWRYRISECQTCPLQSRCTVEHPFGTIKAWMGHIHFLTRTLKNVRPEMALNVLAYNIKRVDIPDRPPALDTGHSGMIRSFCLIFRVQVRFARISYGSGRYARYIAIWRGRYP